MIISDLTNEVYRRQHLVPCLAAMFLVDLREQLLAYIKKSDRRLLLKESIFDRKQKSS